MSLYAQIGTAIRTDFEAFRTSLNPTPQLIPANLPVDFDRTLLTDATAVRPFIRWATREPEIVQGTLGRWRIRGEVEFSIFTALGSPQTLADDLGDLIVERYAGKQLPVVGDSAGPIQFEQCEMRGARVSGPVWLVSIFAPFYVDEVT